MVLKERNAARGKLSLFFTDPKRLFAYIGLILVGVPIWCTVGILIMLSPEFAQDFGLTQAITAGRAILYTYVGVVIGDFLSGILSQKLRSRRLAIGIFLSLLMVLSTVYLQYGKHLDGWIYWLFFAIGIATGYWVVLMTLAAEKFGTNLRATVTTTVPNFIRGAAIPVTLSFRFLEKEGMSSVAAAQCVSSFTLFLAALSLFLLGETYGRNLDFVEKTVG